MSALLAAVLCAHTTTYDCDDQATTLIAHCFRVHKDIRQCAWRYIHSTLPPTLRLHHTVVCVRVGSGSASMRNKEHPYMLAYSAAGATATTQTRAAHALEFETISAIVPSIGVDGAWGD